MKPSKIILIISSVLFLAVLGIGFKLYRSIKEPIEQQKRIKMVEKAVIDKLVFLKDLQVAYFGARTSYTESFNELIKFVKTENFYIIETSERTVGAYDSVEITYDTLRVVSVQDSLQTIYPDLNERLKNLPQIPYSDSTFRMQAETLVKPNKVEIEVFQIVDTDPVDPDRIERRKGKSPLKIGSLDESSTRGNWE